MHIINDLHLGSTYELPNINYEKALSLAKEDTPTVWLGDICDLKNCKSSEVEMWLTRERVLQGTSKAHKHVWVRGNHGLDQLPGQDEAIIDNTYYTHGDLGLLWPVAKGRAYRAKTPGASWFKRHIISPIINEARELKDAHINDDTIAYVLELKKQYPNITRIVAGHKHPSETIREVIAGVELIVLQRGVNVV